MQYHEAQAQHAAAHPFRVERWSDISRCWLFVADHRSHASAERRIAGYRVYPAYARDTFRIVTADSIELHPAGAVLA